MRLDRFDLNLLVALDVILDECNVTRAGVRLNVGQSAASAALGRLRDYFGDELLMPVGGRLVRTPLAQSLVEPVRDTLARARSTLARRPGFDPASTERRFLMYASDYAITAFLSTAIQGISEKAPGIKLDVRSSMREAVQLFAKGAVDLLFLPEPYMDTVSAPKSKLFEDTHVCVVWSENQDVQNGTFTRAQYMAMGHVAVHYGEEPDAAFEEWFLPRYGEQRRVELTVDSFSMLPLVLVGTNRVATMHRKQAEYFARYFALRLLETPFELPALVEVMSWPAHLDADPAHLWLRQCIHAAIAGGALASPGSNDSNKT